MNQLELEIGLVETEIESDQLNRVPFYRDVLQVAYTSSLVPPNNPEHYHQFLMSKYGYYESQDQGRERELISF